MTVQELEKIKQIQIRIMDEIHRICVIESITYYLIGGTLLGAVRHKGFIPWDVDIDIAMPRGDYERFKMACERELPEWLKYCDLYNMESFQRPHALVCDNNSLIKMKYDYLNPVSENHGIYIDVFPLDNAPDDAAQQKKQAKKLKMIRRFKSFRIPYSYSRKKWKRYAHYAFSAALFWLPIKCINRYQQSEMRKYSASETKYLCSMASQYAYSKQCMPREIYGEPVMLEFEGRNYYAPNKYEEYLERLYGNYMELPPLEKRKANMEIYASVEFF